MILIGENIHIISKSVREALECKNEEFIKNLINIQNNMDYTDLNVGPARGKLEGILPWLCELVEGNSKLKISFDTTNSDEMKRGLRVCKNTKNAFLNSTGKDEPRLGNMTDMAAEYGCNLIALTMGKETGIPKTADGRLEIAFEIYEKCIEKGIDPYVAVAIMLHETGCSYNCSNLVRTCNNVGGQKGSPGCNGGSYKAYATLDDGIIGFINNLQKNYYSQGLTTIDSIAPKYAASSAWPAKIKSYVEQIRAS